VKNVGWGKFIKEGNSYDLNVTYGRKPTGTPEVPSGLPSEQFRYKRPSEVRKGDVTIARKGLSKEGK